MMRAARATILIAAFAPTQVMTAGEHAAGATYVACGDTIVVSIRVATT